MSASELERNKAVALRFKKSQGTKDMPQVEKEVLAPGYNRIRGGNFHLAANAQDQGWPHPGMYLRTAFPDACPWPAKRKTCRRAMSSSTARLR